MGSKKSLTYRSSEMRDCPTPSEISRKKIGHYGVKISKSVFRLGPTRIVFSSFCRSRKVVWDQSELKNHVGIGLAILP
jgi:hypothetical protein